MWRAGNNNRRSPLKRSSGDYHESETAHIGLSNSNRNNNRIMSMGRRQQQRKRQRARELEEEGAEEEQGPPSRTRARIKRKQQHDMALKSASTEIKQGIEELNQGDDQSNNRTTDQQLVLSRKESPARDDHDTCTGQPSVASSTILMPEKHTLELILDTLQRRDTYEIFAEPIDPQEVEDYYDIIKEPMDFGTMRAKLHEGMYKSLEQFERDVFLISGNAMHFNSSATIYFRQARAIHELAKRVFHVLKTDPENFVSEFSGARRRSGRRLQGETKELNFTLGSTLPRNVGGPGYDVSSKGSAACSLTSPSIFRRSLRGNLGLTSTASPSYTGSYDLFFSSRESKRSSSFQADRRCTYSHWMHNENDSLVSRVYSDSKPLLLVNQQEITYRESLMLFSKDLGPTAQKIAKRKLQGLSGRGDFTKYHQTPRLDCSFDVPTHQDSSALGLFSQRRENVIDQLPGSRAVPKPSSGIMDLTEADKMGNAGVLGGDTVTSRKQNNARQLEPSSSNAGFSAGAMNLSNTGINYTDSKHTSNSTNVFKEHSDHDKVIPFKVHSVTNIGLSRPTLATGLDSSDSTVSFGFKFANKNWTTSSSPWVALTRGVSCLSQSNGSGNKSLGSECQATAMPLPGAGNGISNSSHSRFTFDLPFLTSQLNQSNFMGQENRFLQQRFQQGSGTDQGSLFDHPGSYNKMSVNCNQPAEPVTRAFLDNQPRSTTPDNPDTDLVLQL